MGAAAAAAWRRTEEPGSGELEWRASACSSILAVAAALRGACAARLCPSGLRSADGVAGRPGGIGKGS